MSSAAAVAPRYEVEVGHQALDSGLSSIILVGITVLLFLVPLCFGAVEPWAIFLFESACSLLSILWVVHQLRQGELRIVGSPLYRPMIAFAGLVLVQFISKQTANGVETVSEGLLYVAYGLLCFLTIQTLRRTNQLRTLAFSTCIFSATLAIFALVQGLGPNGKLYWLRTPRFGGWIYGPYVNHNHYAGLMELLVPIPIAVCLSRHVTRRNRILAASVAAIVGSTILLSGSRGGMVAFAGQMVVLILFRGQRPHGQRKLKWTVVAIAAIAFAVWAGGRDLANRITTIPGEAKTELSGGTRIRIDRDALRMIARKPILGWGLGTFGDIYPQFRTFPTDLVIDKAHNDYVQLLVEMGVLGFVVMLWFLVLTYRAAIRKLENAGGHASRELALAAIVGVTGILIHSFFDFNLQIPANAAWFYVLCAVAVMELDSTHDHRRARRTGNHQVAC